MTTQYFLAATLSWIDPRTALPEVDVGGEPPATITKADVKSAKFCRFANLMELHLQTNGGGHVMDGSIAGDSGLFFANSFLNTTPVQVGRIGRKKEKTGGGLSFQQLVGCRTEAPEKIAQTIGGSIGRKIGGTNSTAEHLGKLVGRELGEWAQAFPPIWSEIEAFVTIGDPVATLMERYQSGKTRRDMALPTTGGPRAGVVKHSLFPSLSFYVSGLVASPDDAVVLGRVDPTTGYLRQGDGNRGSYDGVPRLRSWQGGGGWGSMNADGRGHYYGNPWSMTSPAGSLKQGLAGLMAAGSLNQTPVGY